MYKVKVLNFVINDYAGLIINGYRFSSNKHDFICTGYLAQCSELRHAFSLFKMLVTAKIFMPLLHSKCYSAVLVIDAIHRHHRWVGLTVGCLPHLKACMVPSGTMLFICIFSPYSVFTFSPHN